MFGKTIQSNGLPTGPALAKKGRKRFFLVERKKSPAQKKNKRKTNTVKTGYLCSRDVNRMSHARACTNAPLFTILVSCYSILLTYLPGAPPCALASREVSLRSAGCAPAFTYESQRASAHAKPAPRRERDAQQLNVRRRRDLRLCIFTMTTHLTLSCAASTV